MEPPAGAKSSSTTIGVSRRVLGDDHPDTLVSIHNIKGSLLRELGRLEEAEALGAEAVDRARRSLSAGHWRTGVHLHSYGRTLTKLARHEDAEQALLEAQGILSASLGAEHQLTMKAVNALADLYDAWGKPDKAAEWRAKLPEEEDSKEQDD